MKIQKLCAAKNTKTRNQRFKHGAIRSKLLFLLFVLSVVHNLQLLSLLIFYNFTLTNVRRFYSPMGGPTGDR